MTTTTAEADHVTLQARVSQVALPADARELSTLPRVDYDDAFLVHADSDQTAEQWARAVFNDAPLGVRARLVSGWLGLGLKLAGPRSPNRVLGWKVRESSSRVMLLAADSLLGLRAELLLRTEPGGLLFATFVQQNTAAARAVWVRITPTHQRVVHSLLDHAARRSGE